MPSGLHYALIVISFYINTKAGGKVKEDRVQGENSRGNIEFHF